MEEKLALVTGACGFCGPRVIHYLLEAGWKVRATALPTTPRDGIAPFMDKIEFMTADITDKDAMLSITKDVHTVFHTAAKFSFSASMDVLKKINVDGTRNILEGCIKNDVKKMVMWSSVALYGKADPKFYQMPIKENTILNPNMGGLYDQSKRLQEEVALKYWEENKFPISNIRLAPMYGPNSYYGIYTLFRMVNYEMLPIVPQNLHKASIPLVHVDDVARSALFLSDVNKFNGEAYNLADDYTLDLVDTLKFVAALCDSKFKVILPIYPLTIMKPFLDLIAWWSGKEAKIFREQRIKKGKPLHPKIEADTLNYLWGNFYFDNAKIKKEGFEFLHPDRRTGLTDTILWYQKNGWEKTNIRKEEK